MYVIDRVTCERVRLPPQLLYDLQRGVQVGEGKGIEAVFLGVGDVTNQSNAYDV
jgi:hypothetical protein